MTILTSKCIAIKCLPALNTVTMDLQCTHCWLHIGLLSSPPHRKQISRAQVFLWWFRKLIIGSQDLRQNLVTSSRQQAAVNVTEEWTIEKLIISAHAMFHCYTVTVVQHYANVRRITPVTAGMYSKWKVKTFILCQQFPLSNPPSNSWIMSFRILFRLHIFALGAIHKLRRNIEQPMVT